ncbi:hypothetical protein C0993_002923 [Termitomyces sp. T159_Od127]|nr:hypothetical protein C0993_002923 [Termitomyces sp. T159_Od127]
MANHHNQAKADRWKQHKIKKRKPSKTSQKPLSTVKPIPPEKYDGASDVQKFMQFMNQCSTYLTDGYVEKRRHITVVASFLTGKAWNFYSCEVLRRPASWNLERFFKELFNGCFPSDFYNRQQNKLRDFGQGKSLMVCEYVAELEELFIYVGSISTREKIVKLFNGFRTSIKRGLYRAGLDPELSRWNEIISQAEFLERAEGIDFEDQRTDGGSRFKPLRHLKPNSAYQNHQKGQNYVDGRNKTSFDRSKYPFRKQTNNTTGYSLVKENSHGPKGSKPEHHKKQHKKSEMRTNLSDKQMAEYKADNRCFGCGEGNPGLIANNIQIDLQSIEKLRDDALGNTTKELTVGAISFLTQADPIQENSRERSDRDPSWETENDIPQLGEVSDTDDNWMEALFEDDLNIDQIQKKEQSSSPEQSEDGESSSTADTDDEDLTTVVTGPPMTFSWGEESYDKIIRYPEEKLDLL